MTEVCEPLGHSGHDYEHLEPVGDDWCWWSQEDRDRVVSEESWD